MIFEKKERVFLVSVFRKSDSSSYIEEMMTEFEQLTQSAGLKVIKIFKQNLEKPNFSTYIGKGKIREIANRAKKDDVKSLIFNENLSPGQARNISTATRCNVVDRTELILDIFAKHARTNQAKLQVELAQLEYSFTKLKHLWKHLSRIQGGIGFRGPGEKQLETDKREITKKIIHLRHKLDNIKKRTNLKRKKMNKFISISLVGYTNTGKSTIFNYLTKESRYTADKLFATLDSTTRSIFINLTEKVMLSDTIGFIRNIPHKLISSFHSTLMEVLEADLLLHVIDISQPQIYDYIASVEKILKEIGVDQKNILTVFNKTDKLDPVYLSFIKKKLSNEYHDSVFISAKNGSEINQLIKKIEKFVHLKKIHTLLKIPFQMKDLLQYVYKNAEIIEDLHDEINQEHLIKLRIKQEIYNGVQQQIDKHRFLKKINSI